MIKKKFVDIKIGEKFIHVNKKEMEKISKTHGRLTSDNKTTYYIPYCFEMEVNEDGK